ncbi:AmpG family muropeptide MFS transporter [uncultured Pseudoteredinibacter sp.]|uniref:AmpG family muropeptide MFS transporter n=1 Tax=uncultured Pseudoteredinibacter sp. TaxID=1641701 RepID=UPI00261610E3|nr:AmpG family muropeptide MFS transporter [uncultured Pseudoteredinibacter sp.]
MTASQPSLKAAIFNRRMLTCVFTGMASGLPLYVLIQLVPLWLREEGVGLKEIGFFTLVTFPYTWKFIWAPLLDRYSLLPMGRRRSWLLVTQLGLMASIAALGYWQPVTDIKLIAAVCFLVAVLSATQDIAIDAFRREILPDEELGMGTSIHVQAYRISGLLPGGLSFILADHISWQQVFWVTGAYMVIGLLMTLFVKEAVSDAVRPKTLQEAVVNPFKDFVGRHGKTGALLVLSFMCLYKFGDNLAVALSTPFYYDLGFTKTQVGLVAKNAGLWSSIVGALLGGIIMIRIGINKALWVFGVVQLVSILGFAVLAYVGANVWVLAGAIILEYLGVGLGTAAFSAYMARITNPLFAATQFALLSALASFPRTIASSLSGILVEHFGWVQFFIMCSLTAIPGMLLLFKVAPWRQQEEAE